MDTLNKEAWSPQIAIFRQLLRMRSTKIVTTCIFNKLLDADLFLALEGTSMRSDLSTNERKYRRLVNNVFIRIESLFVVLTARNCNAACAYPCGLSNTDYQIWENISHVALWEILLARIRSIIMIITIILQILNICQRITTKA